MKFEQTLFPFAEESNKQMNEIQTPSLIVPDGTAILDDNQKDCLEGDIEEYDDKEDTSVMTLESETDDPSVLQNVQICGDCWTNTELVPIEKITCKFPEKLLNKIKNIEKCVNKKLNGSNEFSIYIHGDFDANGDLVVSEDFYIPKQNVSTASVDYLEQPDEYYNGCLHKHPDGCKNFSGTDKKYINSNFEFSLLYVCKEVRLGIMNLKYFKNRRIQVPVEIKIDDGVPNEDIDITNILKEKPKVVTPVTPTVQKFPTFEPPQKIIKEKQDEIILPSVFNGGQEEMILGQNSVDDLIQSPESIDDMEFPYMDIS